MQNNERATELKEIVVEVTKDQLSAVGKAFLPFKKDFIKLSFVESNLVFETSELGHTGKITLGNESVRDEFVGVSFFVSKSVIAKIEAVMQETAKLRFKNDGEVWMEMVAEVKGDNINIGLPIFEEAINTTYTKLKEETIDSEIIVEALKNAEYSVVPNSETLACVEIGKQLTFGSSQSIVVIDNILQDLTLKVAEDFRKHITNIAKLGDKTTFIQAQNEKEQPFVVVRVENVEYKTAQAPHRLPDMSKLVQGKQAKFKIDIPTLQESLARISIPLMDADAEMIMTIKRDKLELSIFDIQHRHSGSSIQVVVDEAQDNPRANVNIKAIMSVANGLNADTTITIGTNTNGDVTALVLEDSKQKTYLATNIE